MKQKTHRAAKKRFKTTGSGKVRGRKANARHMMVNKSKGQKKMQGKAFLITGRFAKTVKTMLSS